MAAISEMKIELPIFNEAVTLTKNQPFRWSGYRDTADFVCCHFLKNPR